MSSNQTIIDGLSSDLKVTNMVGIGFGFGGLIVGLYMMFAMWPVWGSAAIASGVVLGGVGGVTGMVVVFLGANAAMGGAYVNAAASLTGVTVSSGATPLPVPTTQTPAQQTIGGISQTDITNLVNQVTALQAAVKALSTTTTTKVA